PGLALARKGGANLLGSDVPEPQEPVVVCRCDAGAVAREGDGRRWPHCTCQWLYFLAGGHVPEADSAVRARRSKGASIWTEVETQDNALVTGHGGEFFCRFRIPDSYGSSRAA